MRVLFISRWYPYPPDNGSKIRIFNLIKHLSRRHEVTLLSFCQGEVSEAHLKPMQTYCPIVHTVPYRSFNPARLKALLGFFSLRPRSFVDTYSHEMATLVAQVGVNGAFDVVVASERDMALYPFLLEGTARVLEDIELAVLHEQCIRERLPVIKARRGLMWWKMSRFTARLLRRYQGATVVSEQERDLLLQVAPDYDPLAVVPNGVDLETYTGNFGTPEPDTLIYPGALTYDANFDAMDFFLRDIFPLVRAQRPDARLHITGRYDGVPVDRLPLSNGEGVELTGYLDDVRPAVAQSWACVVPLRVGGGTRLKVLEAMALGTPVIATSKGAEGLKVIHGENILIADELDDFAQTLIRLLQDKSLRAKLSANGRRLVEEWYSWEICARQLEQLLYRVVGHEIPSSD